MNIILLFTALVIECNKRSRQGAPKGKPKSFRVFGKWLLAIGFSINLFNWLKILTFILTF